MTDMLASLKNLALTLTASIIILSAPACGPLLPPHKIDNIIKAEQTHDARAVPDLVNQLDDPDPSVRMFASRCLRKITGQNFGYKHFHSKQKRAPAIEKWIQYVKDNPKRTTPPKP